MDSHPPSSDCGHSPNIAAELLLHGRQINIASLGPSSIVVRTDRPAAPGTGVIRLTVGEQVTIYHVHLPQGIDPDRFEQPFQFSKEAEEAAA